MSGWCDLLSVLKCPDSFLRESPGDPSLRRSQGPLGGAEERPPGPRTTTWSALLILCIDLYLFIM